MPQPNKIPLPFAASGDKNTIPENTETTGLASWRDGFPAITSAPFSEGGVAPKRADFNGIFYALSQAIMWLQQGGVYIYDVNTDYEAGNVVLDAGGLYVANSANGPSSAVVQPSSDTTGATWKLVRLNLATPTAAGYMSGADKKKLDGLISTDATPSAAGYMSAADKTKLDGLISTNATQSAAGYMSAEDKTALDGVPSTYFPKSGGTLNGSLIQRNIDSSQLILCGGIGNTGAHIYLNGKDNSTNPGLVILYAKDDVDSANLKLYPEKQLSLSDKFIYPVAYEYLAQDHIRIEYDNKLQILADWIAGSNGESITFARAFAATPVVFLSVRSNSNANLGAYDITTTGFKLYSTESGSLNVSCIAIGKGA